LSFLAEINLLSEITSKDIERWLFAKSKISQNQKQSQNNSTSKQMQAEIQVIEEQRWANLPYEKKYYDIFNLYYYIVAGTEDKPQISFATLRRGIFRDCSTYEIIDSKNVIYQCFVFEGENCRSDTWKCRFDKGVFFATTPSVKYRNYRVNFTYFEQEPRQIPYYKLNIGNNNIKSYESQTTLEPYAEEWFPSFVFKSTNPYILPFYYRKEHDIDKQPKLCLQLNDLENSQQIINDFISTSYNKINCNEIEEIEQKQQDEEFEQYIF